MEKLSSNRAQLFVRNKYTVFTMGGTVALRSVNKIFSESSSSAAIGSGAVTTCLNDLGLPRLRFGHPP